MRRLRVYQCCIILMLLSTLWFLLQQYKSRQTTSSPAQKMKNILYWTPMFKHVNFTIGLGSEKFAHCIFKNCYATHDRSYLPIDEFDAIIFHALEYTEEKFGTPERRDPRQMYVFALSEPPPGVEHPFSKNNNFYNWTMSYRLDADIQRLHGSIKILHTNYQHPQLEDIQARPSKIAWFASNCRTPGERERIVKELAEIIPVDVYGRCGSYSCTKKDQKCYDLVEQNYKFYLSFENAVCQDYVTEKVFNILRRNIVPVVYGGCNYDQRTPPNSVINVMDFKSVQDLAKYLQYLNSHPEEYLKFFDWKKDYVVDRIRVACNLCQKLNEAIAPKVYSDVGRWYLGENGNLCSNKFIQDFL